MRPSNEELEKDRIVTGPMASDRSYGMEGAFEIEGPYRVNLFVISGNAEGWEHVSVSLAKRYPNWHEMCFIKDMFWDSEETVIQYHPPRSQAINNHPHCLHLWKPVNITIPLPPSILVGFKEPPKDILSFVPAEHTQEFRDMYAKKKNWEAYQKNLSENEAEFEALEHDIQKTILSYIEKKKGIEESIAAIKSSPPEKVEDKDLEEFLKKIKPRECDVDKAQETDQAKE